MKLNIILPVLIGVFILGSFGFEPVSAETLIAVSGGLDPAHFSKVNVTTADDLEFLGNPGPIFGGIAVSPIGKLYAAPDGDCQHEEEGPKCAGIIPGLYELSVIIDNGKSVVNQTTLVVPNLECNDISFSPNGTLYCVNFDDPEEDKNSLYSVDVNSGDVSLIGILVFTDSDGIEIEVDHKNGLAINSTGEIHFVNRDGLYIFDFVTGFVTEVAPLDVSDTGLQYCRPRGMSFDSSDLLYVSFECQPVNRDEGGIGSYLVAIDSSANVTSIGHLNSSKIEYNVNPFNSPRGDMRTSSIVFTPFDFDFLVGTTHGTVNATEFVTVTPNPIGNGVQVNATAPVIVDLCENSSFVVGSGDSFTAECGSVTIQVVYGTVVAEFLAEDGSFANAILNEGDNVTFDEILFSFTNNDETNDVHIVVNGESDLVISPGETVILDDPPTTSLEHFMSYKAKIPKGTEKFEKFTVTLSDQFDTNKNYTVEKPERLFNPVDKNEEGLTDKISHMVGYKIKEVKGEPKFEKITGLIVSNQFGDITLDVKKPKLILVPSAKNHDATPDVLNPVTIDHFTCYDVKETKHTPKFEKRPATAHDPNFEITKEYEIKKPKLLCIPVEKTHNELTSAITSPDENLLCYDAKKPKSTEKFEKLNVFTNNQFGSDELKIDRVEDLCIPSTYSFGGLPNDEFGGL